MNTAHAVAGIDPHKHTATVAVVDFLGVLVVSMSFAVSDGFSQQEIGAVEGHRPAPAG